MKKFKTLIKTQLVDPENQKGEALLSTGDVEVNSVVISDKVIDDGVVELTSDDVPNGDISAWRFVNASLVDGSFFIPDVSVMDDKMVLRFGNMTENQDNGVIIMLMKSSTKGVKSL